MITSLPHVKFGAGVVAAFRADAPLYVLAPATRPDLPLKVSEKTDVRFLTGKLSETELAALAEGIDKHAILLALADSATAAAARYLAWKTGARLVIAPLVIMGEQLFSTAVTVTEDEETKELGRKTADLLLDPSLIWDGPEMESRAAVCEILALLTALEDRRQAARQHAAAFDERIADQVHDLVSEAMDWADEIAELSQPAIKKLFELLQKRQKLETAFPFYASEHLLRDLLRQAAPHLSPAPLLGLATALIMEAQGKSSRPLRQFLFWLHLPSSPHKIGLNDDILQYALLQLPRLARKKQLPHLATAYNLPHEKIPAIILALREPLIKSSLMERKK